MFTFFIDYAMALFRVGYMRIYYFSKKMIEGRFFYWHAK